MYVQLHWASVTIIKIGIKAGKLIQSYHLRLTQTQLIETYHDILLETCLGQRIPVESVEEGMVPDVLVRGRVQTVPRSYIPVTKVPNQVIRDLVSSRREMEAAGHEIQKLALVHVIVTAGDGQATGNQAEQQNSQRIIIHSTAIILVGCHLGGCIFKSPGKPTELIVTIVNGQAKIDQFDVVLGANQNVASLQISINYTLGMEVLQCRHNLRHVLLHGGTGNTMSSSQSPPQVLPWNVLDGEE